MQPKLAHSPQFLDVSPPPEAPFFDPAQNAWVLSRYADVLAALREPALRQTGSQKKPDGVRQDVLSALAQSKISEWQEQIEPLARSIMAKLPRSRPVDLVSEVLRPWSLAVTNIVLGLDGGDARKLAALQAHLAGGTSQPSRRSLSHLWRAIQRRIANLRLRNLLRGVRVRGAQSLFLGVSQTLPDFLANAWLTLLEHPLQLALLCADPLLAPKTVEELLRYRGPVHTLVRVADQTLQLAGVTVARRERVILKMDLANRDPERFTDPTTFDIARQSVGHLGLGAGPHSCVGALLLRMAAISATRAFAEYMSGAELVEPVVWRRGSTLDSPLSVQVWSPRNRPEKHSPVVS